VKKSKSEVQKQNAEHTVKAKLKKQRREEQERNVAAKKNKLVSPSDEDDEDEADASEVFELEEESGDEVRLPLRPTKKRKLPT
jgi:ribosome biogenesis protein SSF1/2